MWAYNGHVQSYMHCAMLESITWVYGTCDLVLLIIYSICLIEYCHGYGRWAVPYLVIACAVLASLLDATYDGGEWEPGYVIVLSTWIFFIFLLWVLLLAHLSSVFPSYTTFHTYSHRNIRDRMWKNLPKSKVSILLYLAINICVCT